MGRSGGGGGGHSGGGHSGGSFGGGGSSGRSSGSFGGGGFSGRSGGGFGGRSSSGHSSGGGFHTGPIFINNSRRYYGGGGGGGGGNGGGNGGCVGVVFVVCWLLVVCVVLVNLFGIPGLGGDKIAASTIEREPLTVSADVSAGFFTDDAGWNLNKGQMESGLRYFYKQTGVAPYVYIVNTIPLEGKDSNADNMTAYAERMYGRLFQDEAHFILVFHDYGNGQYICGYCRGTQTKTVLDDEALGILNDYLNRYYNDDVSDEEFFSLSFEKTAKRIMTVTKSPWPLVAGGAVVLIIVLLLFTWWKKAKAQKNLEAKQTEEILKAPLEKFGDQELSDLEKKYQQTPSEPSAPDDSDQSQTHL